MNITGSLVPEYHRSGELARLEEIVRMSQGDPFSAPRKLTHPQARMEQLLYWSGKTIPERLAAATALTERMQRMRGITIDEQEADFTPRRVRRRQS
jgi:hypothetical protein